MAIPVMKFSISRDLLAYPQFIQFDAANEHVPNLVFTNTSLPFKCLYNTTGYFFLEDQLNHFWKQFSYAIGTPIIT